MGTPTEILFTFSHYPPFTALSFFCMWKRRNNTHELLAAKWNNSNIKDVVIRRSIMAHMCHKLPINLNDEKQFSYHYFLFSVDPGKHQGSLHFACVLLASSEHIFFLLWRLISCRWWGMLFLVIECDPYTCNLFMIYNIWMKHFLIHEEMCRIPSKTFKLITHMWAWATLEIINVFISLVSTLCHLLFPQPII